MTMVPNCREDEYYNEKYLNRRDIDFVAGFDWAVDDIVELFESNLIVFPALMELLEDNKAVIMEGKAEVAVKCVKEWAEMERNELITSMIDGYSEEEYEKLRAAVEGYPYETGGKKE